MDNDGPDESFSEEAMEGDSGVGAEQDTLEKCLTLFGSSDFIMEPEIFTQLKTYFQAGGNPEQVIELLSKNYMAVAQMANTQQLTALFEIRNSSRW